MPSVPAWQYVLAVRKVKTWPTFWSVAIHRRSRSCTRRTTQRATSGITPGVAVSSPRGRPLQMGQDYANRVVDQATTAQKLATVRSKLARQPIGLEWQNEVQSCDCAAHFGRLGLESGG